MLAHLEHLDLTSLLEDLNWLHISLFDGLDGDLSAGHLVLGQLYETKLSLAESL